MKRLALALAFALALAACASPATEGQAFIGAGGYQTTANRILLADGSAAWLVGCPGSNNNTGACLTRARAVCAGDFRLIERNTVSTGSSAFGAATASGGFAIANQGVDREVLVQCAK